MSWGQTRIRSGRSESARTRLHSPARLCKQCGWVISQRTVGQGPNQIFLSAGHFAFHSLHAVPDSLTTTWVDGGM